MKFRPLGEPPTVFFILLFHLIPFSLTAAASFDSLGLSAASFDSLGLSAASFQDQKLSLMELLKGLIQTTPFESGNGAFAEAEITTSVSGSFSPNATDHVAEDADDTEIIVSIPPLLEEGPPKGELLFTVIHDPAHEPENLTIPCRADALPTPSYSWFKDGEHFNTNDERVSIVKGEGTIVFDDPQPEDAGDYQCVATNAAGSVYSDIVNVRRSITISFPKGEPRVVTVLQGEALSLTCDNPGGYPQPSLHWVLQKSDGTLRSVSSERAIVDENGTLWFSAVSLDDASDESLYACAASSATRTEYRMGNWVFLNVTVPPRIDQDVMEQDTQVAPFKQHVSSSSVTVLEGDDLKLYCIYGGFPVPKVIWWRQDRKQIDDENVVEFGKSLEFLNLDQNIEGKYFCQGSSSAGKTKPQSFTVEVESVPVFDIEPGTINQPIGESATFKCSATGDPEPTIAWSFNGEPLNHRSKIYKLETLTVNDRGVIACNASNKHGYVYSTGFINVLILPPEFTTKPENITSFAGDSVTLTCKSYGSPDPEIEWSMFDEDFDFEEIVDNEDYELNHNNLTIKAMNMRTDGIYKCRAVNKYGEVEAQAHVNLIESTKVELEISEENAKAGEEVTLRCSVSVDEHLHADVTWIKDEISLDFSNNRLESRGDSNDDGDNYDRVLVIRNSKGSDSGTYYCMAKTEQDEENAFVILTVEDVPETPHIEHVQCSRREAYIKWNPGSSNNSPLVGYKIEMQTELNKDKWHEIRNDIPGSTQKAKIELHPGLTHAFRVIATNHVGESEPSSPSKPCTARGTTPDNNPDDLKAETVDASTIKVEWNAIEPFEHNGPDFHYEVRWRVHDDDRNDGDDTWSKIVIEDWEQTEVELEELTPHTEYEIQVNAVNEHGKAADFDSIVATTDAKVPIVAPSRLSILRINTKSAILSWLPLETEDLFGPVKGYEIKVKKANEGTYDDEDIDDAFVKGNTDRAFLGNLEPFTEYEAKVRVLNKIYAGPYSETISFTTSEDASSPVTNLEGRSLSSTSILVEWDDPNSPNGIVKNYVVRYQQIYPDYNNDGKDERGLLREIMTDEDELQVKFSDLEEEALYEISIYPKNDAGVGLVAKIEVQTEQKIPSLPVPPIFTWEVIKEVATTTSEGLTIGDNDSDIDEGDTVVNGAKEGEGTDDSSNGDKDSKDDDHPFILLSDRNKDGVINNDDVTDINEDGYIDAADIAALDIDRDGDVDEDYLKSLLGLDDLIDFDGDGDIDIYDLIGGVRDGDGNINEVDKRNRNAILQAADGDGDIDIEDVFVDIDDIDDEDGDGDIDADDVRAADTDGDGDIDLADDGLGISIKISWQPDTKNNPGSEFYIKYRPVGHKFWRKSKVEKKSLHQTLTGLDPYSVYEVQMIATDGEFKTPSKINLIGPFEEELAVEPTVGAVTDDPSPWMWTWFMISFFVAIFMLFIILFSVWVYHRRMVQVSELRAQLYEGYEPPSVIAKKGDLEASIPMSDEEKTAQEQRAQMAALLRRQETIQSVDSFASHDDDFAEYGDETMAFELLTSVALNTNQQQGQPPKA